MLDAIGRLTGDRTFHDIGVVVEGKKERNKEKRKGRKARERSRKIDQIESCRD